jgi:hypothetical protein
LSKILEGSNRKTERKKGKKKKELSETCPMGEKGCSKGRTLTVLAKVVP